MIHALELPNNGDPRLQTVLETVHLYEQNVDQEPTLTEQLVWHPQLNMAVAPLVNGQGEPTGWMRGLVFHATTEPGDLHYVPDYSRQQLQITDQTNTAQRRKAVTTRAHGDGFYTGNRPEVTDNGREVRPIGAYLTDIFNVNQEVYEKRARFMSGMFHLARMVVKESIAPHIPAVDTLQFAERANRKLDRAGARIALINQAPRHRARYMDFPYEDVSPQYMLVRSNLQRVGEVAPAGDYTPRQLGTLAMYGYGFTRAAWKNARDAKHHGVKIFGSSRFTSKD